MKNNVLFLLSLEHINTDPEVTHLRMVSEFAAKRENKKKYVNNTFSQHNVKFLQISFG